jgi:hypothetical protein
LLNKPVNNPNGVFSIKTRYNINNRGPGVAQSVKRLAMGWMTERLEFDSR